MVEIGGPITAPSVASGMSPGVRALAGGFAAGVAGGMRSLAQRVVAERDRFSLWAPVLMAIGIVAYFSLTREPPPLLGALGVAAATMVFLAAGTAAPTQRSRIRLAAAIPGLIALGFSAAQLQTALVSTTPLTQRIGPVGLTGIIRDIELFPDGARIVLDDPHARGKRVHLPTRVRIRLRGDDLPPIVPGDRIAVSAILSPPPAPVIPGGYDFQRDAFFSDLGAVGFAVGALRVLPAAEEDGESRIATELARLRHAISEEVRRVIAPPAGTVIIALLVGEKRAIPQPVMAAIRDSGLAHLLAISGLHIGVVALLVMVALRSGLALVPAVALRYPIKKWAACGSALAAGFYTLLAGAPVPSQRAFFMVLIVLVAVLVDRRTTPMRLVAIAAAVLCLSQPVTVLGPSFQMSFFAVAALIALYEWTRSRPAWISARAERWRLFVYLAGITMTSLVARVATAPFVVFHFNRLALFGLIANLVAVPLTSVWILPWAILSLVLMPFGLGWLALHPMAWGVDVVIWIAERVAAWPGAVVQLPPMPQWALAAAAAGLLWLCLWRTRWRLFGLVPITAAVVATLTSAPPDLLIDGKGKLIAVRAADGTLILSSARASAMAREAWLRASEKAETVATFPIAGTTADGRLACDALGCIWHRDGHVIAIARSGDALAEDCQRADAVISVVPVRHHCRSPRLVIDRFDLWREGAHAVWVRPDGIRSVSVDGMRGDRPWVPDKLRQAKTRRQKTAEPADEDSGDGEYGDDGTAAD